jgi:AcrR family transcriptional regulator
MTSSESGSQSRRRAERVDAVANRERILAAAETYFAQHGIDAPLRGVAERAAVGSGTLYRHFPTHADLVRGLYDRFVARLDVVADRCAQAPTGWEAVLTFIDGAAEVMMGAPVMSAVMRRQAENDPGYRPGRRWEEPLRQSVAAAIAEEQLRPDVRPTDVALVPYLLGSLASFPEPMRTMAFTRLRSVVVDGLRRTGAGRAPLGEVGLHVDELHAMVHDRPPERF